MRTVSHTLVIPMLFKLGKLVHIWTLFLCVIEISKSTLRIDDFLEVTEIKKDVKLTIIVLL